MQTLLLLSSLLLAPAAVAQDLWVVNDDADTVMLVSGFDGSILDPAFLDISLSGTVNFPLEAIAVEGEIWISDQNADVIYRFSGDGTTYLGNVGGPRDNVRGMAYSGGSVYVANSGSGGGAPGDVVKEYATDGTLLSTFPNADPYDVVEYGGELLVTNINSDDIERYAHDGTFLGVFHDSDGVTGIDFPEQMSVRASGNLLVGGLVTPAGIYEYDPSGVEVAYHDTGFLTRGAHELGNGLLLASSSSGLYTWDPVNGGATVVTPDSTRFISRAQGGDLGTSYCTSTVNSTGGAGMISGSGTVSVAANNLLLGAEPLPAGQSGVFFYGPSPVLIAFGNGFRCVGPGATGIARLAVSTVSPGQVLNHPVDLTQPPTPATQITAGSTWYFQGWYRDPAGGGAFFNLTDGLELTFAP